MTCINDNVDAAQKLWSSFMPKLDDIRGRVDSSLISMQVFDENFDPNLPSSPFEKWAVVEVQPHSVTPQGMLSYHQTGGLYAVFLHQGPAQTFAKTMHAIFVEWLPNSEYQLDQREHFEVMPANYRPDDPTAREEVWIPIKAA